MTETPENAGFVGIAGRATINRPDGDRSRSLRTAKRLRAISSN